MERIRQAVDKAKVDGVPNSQANLADELVVAPPEHGNGIEAVEYSQTRVYEPDLDHFERHRIVAFSKMNRHSAYFDMLRTQILSKMDEKGWRTLAIVSVTPENGKTMVAINLAMSIAHNDNKTAILVDFDLRRPKVAHYLGIPRGKSLNEVLSGEASVHEAMVNPGLPKFVVLPADRPVPKSSEMLSSNKVLELVQELRERYPERIVIFDLPPLLYSDDAISILPAIDCVLLVVGNGMVSKSELDEGLRYLQTSNVLGAVLNKADVQPRDGYYY